MKQPETQLSQDEASHCDVPKMDTPSSSQGTVSPSVTPKEVCNDTAAAKNVTERKTDSDNLEEREEALLDEAIDLSFPASDPIAVPSYDKAAEKWKTGKDTSGDQPDKTG